MSDKHLGSCLCGQVRFKITGQFDSFYLCHCEYCRKDTGSAHAANLFSKSASLQWLSGQSLPKAFNVPTTRHIKCFCSHCGSALPYQEEESGLLVVPAGSLDSKLTIRPTAHIFASSRAEWDHELEHVTTFDTFPQ